jgi:flagellar motor component MotA
MVRYLVSLLVFAGGIILALFFAGVTPLALLDLPSFFLTVVVPLLFMFVVYGFKETGAALSAPFKKDTDKDQLAKAAAFIKLYGKSTCVMGIIGVLTGIIVMFANLDDKSQVGPSVALALVSLLYSGVVQFIIVIPFTVFLKKQQKEL